VLRTFEYGGPNAEDPYHNSKQSRDRSRAGTAREHADECQQGGQNRHQYSHCAKEALQEADEHAVATECYPECEHDQPAGRESERRQLKADARGSEAASDCKTDRSQTEQD
jgi:hypothetical protein